MLLVSLATVASFLCVSCSPARDPDDRPARSTTTGSSTTTSATSGTTTSVLDPTTTASEAPAGATTTTSTTSSTAVPGETATRPADQAGTAQLARVCQAAKIVTINGRAMQSADDAKVAAGFMEVSAALDIVVTELNGAPNNPTVRLRDQAALTSKRLEAAASPKAARRLVDGFLARNATLIVDVTEQYKVTCPELRDDAPQ